jgi:predicted dehydrogenase
MRVGYRAGDMWAPKVDGAEALLVEGKHFVDAIKNGKKTISDGEFGCRMVELIEAATASMRGRGETIHLPKKSK